MPIVTSANIHIPKGDTYSTEVSISINGVHRPLVDGEDIIYFSMKNTVDDTSYVFQEIVTTFNIDGNADLVILPSETVLFVNKQYLYDMQWNQDTGEVHTFLKGKILVDTDNITEE